MRMERVRLLRTDADTYGDQALETDVMRFLAIVGVVFWMLFAIVKSIPLKAREEVAPSNKEPLASRPKTPEKEAAIPKIHPVAAKKEKKKKLEKKVPKKVPKPLKETAKAPRPKAPEHIPKGVRLEFSSMEDLMGLMREHKVSLYVRARARGFDLLFLGHTMGMRIEFSPASALPGRLWEIKGGADHKRFVALVTGKYPAVSAFPRKEVFVHFVDTDLERAVEEAFNMARRKGESSVISIKRTGEIAFE